MSTLWEHGDRSKKKKKKIPRLLDYDQQLKWNNGNTLWMEDYDKETKNNAIVFKVIHTGDKYTCEKKSIHIHIIWDVKINLQGNLGWQLTET